MQMVYTSIVLLTLLLTHHSPFLTDERLRRKNGTSSLSPWLSVFRSSFIYFCSFSCTQVNSQGWPKPALLPVTGLCDPFYIRDGILGSLLGSGSKPHSLICFISNKSVLNLHLSICLLCFIFNCF